MDERSAGVVGVVGALLWAAARWYGGTVGDAFALLVVAVAAGLIAWSLTPDLGRSRGGRARRARRRVTVAAVVGLVLIAAGTLLSALETIPVTASVGPRLRAAGYEVALPVCLAAYAWIRRHDARFPAWSLVLVAAAALAGLAAMPVSITLLVGDGRIDLGDAPGAVLHADRLASGLYTLAFPAAWAGIGLARWRAAVPR